MLLDDEFECFFIEYNNIGEQKTEQDSLILIYKSFARAILCSFYKNEINIRLI